MELLKQALGAISLFLTIVGYAPYLRSIFLGSIRPHMFSWIVWGVSNSIAFFGPYSRGAGAGAWVAGLTAIICFFIAVVSIFKGERIITRGDWVAFVVSLAAIPLWYVTKDPTLAIVLATGIDVVSCYPTVRKSWNAPYSENLFTWIVNGLRSAISLIAVENFSFATVLFPVAMILANGGIAGMLAVRRQALEKPGANADSAPAMGNHISKRD